MSLNVVFVLDHLNENKSRNTIGYWAENPIYTPEVSFSIQYTTVLLIYFYKEAMDNII